MTRLATAPTPQQA
jgi:hypothetical protein